MIGALFRCVDDVKSLLFFYLQWQWRDTKGITGTYGNVSLAPIIRSPVEIFYLGHRPAQICNVTNDVQQSLLCSRLYPLQSKTVCSYHSLFILVAWLAHRALTEIFHLYVAGQSG